jgi:hypothetical protein
LFDARSAALEGIAQHLLTTNVARTTVYGTSQVLSDAGSSLANSTIRGVGGVVNEGTVATYVGGVGLATPQSITGLTIQPSFAAPRVGSPAYTVATTADMELFATVIWNSDTAKTSAELTTVYTFLSGNYT